MGTQDDNVYIELALPKCNKQERAFYEQQMTIWKYVSKHTNIVFHTIYPSNVIPKYTGYPFIMIGYKSQLTCFEYALSEKELDKEILSLIDKHGYTKY